MYFCSGAGDNVSSRVENVPNPPHHDLVASNNESQIEGAPEPPTTEPSAAESQPVAIWLPTKPPKNMIHGGSSGEYVRTINYSTK